MNKFFVPAALALALTASGGAFAASMNDDIDLSLYEESSFFTEVKAPAFTSAAYWQKANPEAQRASTARMADSRVPSAPVQAPGFKLPEPE
jgi:hypothetical protein